MNSKICRMARFSVAARGFVRRGYAERPAEFLLSGKRDRPGMRHIGARSGCREYRHDREGFGLLPT